MAAGEGDKARNLFERCAAESTWWCQKAQELGDQAKAAYAKTHLALASGAKSAGKLDGCLAEASKVLEFDTANSEAQGLKSQCQQHEVPKAEPARSEAPGPRDREAKAARLAKASYEKLMARDFSGAVKDAQSALSQSPSDKNTLMNAYRSLGYGYAYLNDKPNAVKWLEKYLPFCTNDCDQVHAFIGK
jgi:tetratricopeptide (TPR) repeat protein